MRAHIVQLDIAWEDKAANFAKVERLLDGADVREGDLVLLPEMFDTGFSLNTDATADAGGVTLAFLARLSEDLGAVVQGGRTVRDCHCTHAENRMSVLAPPGDPNSPESRVGESTLSDHARLVCEYAKVHPFSFGREPEKFVGGTRVETYAWRAGEESLVVQPAICYDLRFPELFRLGAKRGAECVALGACWPEARQSHWRALLVARAIENQAFVLGVNRTGRDPHLAYAGGSIALGPRGEVLGELDAREGVLSVELDPAQLRSWREAFPALQDIRLI